MRVPFLTVPLYVDAPPLGFFCLILRNRRVCALMIPVIVELIYLLPGEQP